jgi:RNA polymerase sigma-70 factor, ECF subfamily
MPNPCFRQCISLNADCGFDKALFTFRKWLCAALHDNGGVFVLPGGDKNISLVTPRNATIATSHMLTMAMMLEESDVSDGHLVGRARDGDEAAFGALVERHYDFVYRVAYRWCGKRADAEDIAQEVCIRLGRAIRGFKGNAAFTSWLYALTLNAARDFVRKTRRDAAKAEAYGVHALVSGAVEPAADDAAQTLWAAVRMLPDKQREAVLLVYGEGLSHSAAANMMGSAEATVSWHIHEAKKRLKVLLRQAGEV